MGDAEDVQIRDTVPASLLGFEKLLNSKVETTLVPSSMLGLNCSDGPDPGAVQLPVLATGKRKADGAGFLLRHVAQVPATQSGEDSGASGEGLCMCMGEAVWPL